MLGVACWEFNACLEMLRAEFGRTDLEDDLDPEAERQLCERAARETGIPAVFVLGFPLAARPFYTAPRGASGSASSFDLLFQGLEITTGGQRLHLREDLEAALRSRSIEPANFESHVAMFDMGNATAWRIRDWTRTANVPSTQCSECAPSRPVSPGSI